MLYVAATILTIGALGPGPTAAAAQQAHDTTQDQAAILALEQKWLRAHDRAMLERILAVDFVHPVPSGAFLTKAQHIAWVMTHPRPASTEVSFETLRVRVYGSVALANGIVIARAPGHPPQRTAFTDVFVHRGGRWQAINAQENVVAAP
jgi:Domain of unknown function (DUF4440)